MSKTLKDLSLAPSAVIIVLPVCTCNLKMFIFYSLAPLVVVLILLGSSGNMKINYLYSSAPARESVVVLLVSGSNLEIFIPYPLSPSS